MKTKYGMRALGLLLIVALAGAIFVPGVNAHNATGIWLDSFDQLAGQKDMSRYNPEIKITPTKKIDEDQAKSYPGLMIMDSKRKEEFKEIDAKVKILPDGKMTFSVPNQEKVAGTKSLIPDVRVTEATLTWYWVQDTNVNQEITIHNYDSSAASGKVIFWSIEDVYAYYVTFSNLPAGADLNVTIPFQVIAQSSSVGLKPMGIEIRVDPLDETSFAGRVSVDAIEKYNNDASHLPDPDGGDNLEPSDLYHFPYNDGYSEDRSRVLSEAAMAVDDTNVPYESAYHAMQHVNTVMNYTETYCYIEYIMSDLYTINNASPLDGKYLGVCDEFATLYTSFTRALGIPTRFMAFTMIMDDDNMTGHAVAESWNGSTWVHSDPTWNSYDNPQI
ncbi:transglutaminase-like domain-containing protein [Methanolacinia petrolearia]|uniref:transglutaminase-like domain-containing protein n=1 Tax=Methanolacinia petrolearia TaxID=54120 RepID=UPI003BAB25FF